MVLAFLGQMKLNSVYHCSKYFSCYFVIKSGDSCSVQRLYLLPKPAQVASPSHCTPSVFWAFVNCNMFQSILTFPGTDWVFLKDLQSVS